METETTYQAVLGRILVKKRQDKGIDQETLAHQVGVSRPTWSRIETGASVLNIEQMNKAAHALGTDPGSLLVEADEVVRNLKMDGVKVYASREDLEKVRASREDLQEEKLHKVAAVAFLGGAVLGGLVAAILSSKSSSKDDVPD